MLVDPTKIEIIVNLPTPKTIKQLRETLGYTGYYRTLIRGYATIIGSMEKLSKKDVKFEWNDECHMSLNILKKKMAATSILVSFYLDKGFSCPCRCFVSSTKSDIRKTMISTNWLPDHICELKVFHYREKIYDDKKGRVGNGICVTKTLWVFVMGELQDVYQPLDIEILSQ